jgi:hypothetical protein
MGSINREKSERKEDAGDGIVERAIEKAVERTIARLLPHLAKTGGDELITAKNYEAHFPSKNWRALQSFCQRSGLTKLRIGGTPAYRRVDIEAALAKTAKTPEPVKPEDDVDAAYLKLVRGAK